MAHLAAESRFAFAVVVKVSAWFGGDFRPLQDVVADQIDHFGASRRHRRRPERPARDRANVLLELRRLSPILGPVPGIVHPRRHFVDVDKLPAGVCEDEELDGKDPTKPGRGTVAGKTSDDIAPGTLNRILT